MISHLFSQPLFYSYKFHKLPPVYVQPVKKSGGGLLYYGTNQHNNQRSAHVAPSTAVISLFGLGAIADGARSFLLSVYYTINEVICTRLPARLSTVIIDVARFVC